MTKYTPRLKDDILTFLSDNSHIEQHNQIDLNNIKLIQDKFQIEFHDLNGLLTYFQRLGFISELNSRPICIMFVFRMEGSDFIRTGGFSLRENILQKNLEQLILEIDVLKKELKPDKLETVNKISSIAGVVLNSITGFLHH